MLFGTDESRGYIDSARVKLELCYRLQLLEKDFYHLIENLIYLRNKFAHNPDSQYANLENIITVDEFIEKFETDAEGFLNSPIFFANVFLTNKVAGHKFSAIRIIFRVLLLGVFTELQKFDDESFKSINIEVEKLSGKNKYDQEFNDGWEKNIKEGFKQEGAPGEAAEEYIGVVRKFCKFMERSSKTHNNSFVEWIAALEEVMPLIEESYEKDVAKE